VIVALPADVAAAPPAYLRGTSKPLLVVVGGARRQDSVANAFHHVAERTDVVVVHDAARPFASPDLITKTIAAAAESGAALAALPARDTVKLAGPPEDGLFVQRTLPRESIFLAQTPQAFRRAILGEALTITEMGAKISTAMGVGPVRYNAVEADLYRSFGFPGADEMGNMFQVYRDFAKEVLAARSVDVARQLNPQLQNFDQFLAKNKSKIEPAMNPAPAQ